MSLDKGLLLVVSGPSGVGKSTVIDRLMGNEELGPMFFSVSATTRTPRPGERDGVDYHFVSRAQFEGMIAREEMLEYAQYVGEYYGTPLQPVQDCIDRGGCAIMDIEVQGALQVKTRRPEAVLVFITPPSAEELEKRLRQRGSENEESIRKRLAVAQEERQSMSEYGYRVCNIDPEQAARDLAAIIRAERLSMKRTGKE